MLGATGKKGQIPIQLMRGSGTRIGVQAVEHLDDIGPAARQILDALF